MKTHILSKGTVPVALNSWPKDRNLNHELPKDRNLNSLEAQAT